MVLVKINIQLILPWLFLFKGIGAIETTEDLDFYKALSVETHHFVFRSVLSVLSHNTETTSLVPSDFGAVVENPSGKVPF